MSEFDARGIAAQMVDLQVRWDRSVHVFPYEAVGGARRSVTETEQSVSGSRSAGGPDQAITLTRCLGPEAFDRRNASHEDAAALCHADSLPQRMIADGFAVVYP